MADRLPDRRVRARRRNIAVLIVAELVFVGSFGFVGLKVGENSRDSTQSCSAALRVRDAMVDVLADAQQRTRSTPARTPRESEQATEFYTHAIARLRQADCTP